MPVLKQASRDIQNSIQAARGSAGRGQIAWTSSAAVDGAEEWALAQAKRILESAFSEIGQDLKQRKSSRQTFMFDVAKAI